MMEIRAHLSGERTLATYVQRSNATAHFLVVDIDISKKVLLRADGEEFQKYYCQAGECAKNIVNILRKMGLRGYIEESGYRGYHVWVFFQEWVAVRYINMLSDYLERQLDCTDDIAIEYFPNKTHLRLGKAGQVIKLPYGMHSKTGRRSYLCGDDLSPVEDIEAHLRGIAGHTLNELKRVLSKFSAIKKEKKQLELIELTEKELENVSTGIAAVLKKCSLMRYLYCKSRRTGYLTHGERLSVLYVFGHLGEDGQQFVHTIMEYTMNYQYHVTQKFIDRLPEKPVSCTKLRDQYKQITAEYGCSCNFKRTKNCYPSPVLHAAKLGDEDNLEVTVPTAKTLSREKEKKIREELNLPRKVAVLAKRLQELKKQRRGLEKSIQKVQKELGEVFDGAECDCMETDLGLLSRRSTEGGTEWFIEL